MTPHKQKQRASSDSESVILPEKLASMIRSRCKGDLPGLEPLLLAALRLSVTPDEARYPRVHIRTSYKKLNSLLMRLNLPLEKLSGVAPAVYYPECALLCTWNGNWEISGITKAVLPHDGVGLDITGPLCISITPPDRPIPVLKVIRGQILQYDDSWQAAVAGLGAAAAPEGGRDGGTSAYVLARAIYKVSIGGHGGAFLILPSDPTSCLTDISIGCPAELGPLFDRLLPAHGHMNSELVEECSNALAALTGVDGAVVMNEDLSLLGFGATIKASPKDDESRPQGGHRHKSAMTLCKKHRGTVAIVVSQDGPITVYGTGT